MSKKRKDKQAAVRNLPGEVSVEPCVEDFVSVIVLMPDRSTTVLTALPSMRARPSLSDLGFWPWKHMALSQILSRLAETLMDLSFESAKDRAGNLRSPNELVSPSRQERRRVADAFWSEVRASLPAPSIGPDTRTPEARCADSLLGFLKCIAQDGKFSGVVDDLAEVVEHVDDKKEAEARLVRAPEVSLFLKPLQPLPDVEPKTLKDLAVGETEVHCSENVMRIVELLHEAGIDWSVTKAEEGALRRLLVGDDEERQAIAPVIAVEFYRWFQREKKNPPIGYFRTEKEAKDKREQWILRCCDLLRWIEAMGFGLPSKDESPWEFSLPVLPDVDVAMQLPEEEVSRGDVMVRVVRNLYYLGITRATVFDRDASLELLLKQRVSPRALTARSFGDEVRKFVVEATRLASITGQAVAPVVEEHARPTLRWLEALALGATFDPAESETAEWKGLFIPLERAVSDVDWLAEFDNRHQAVVPKKGTTEEGPVPREEGTSTTPPALGEDFAGASAADLAATFRPEPVPLEAVQRAADLIRAAQDEQPADRRAFVKNIADFLGPREFHIVLLPSKHRSSLAVTESSKSGTIQWSRVPKGESRSLSAHRFAIATPEGIVEPADSVRNALQENELRQ